MGKDLPARAAGVTVHVVMLGATIARVQGRADVRQCWRWVFDKWYFRRWELPPHFTPTCEAVSWHVCCLLACRLRMTHAA